MITIAIILQILTLIGLAAAALFAKSYFPSYLSEKGKNLATKEDIGAITRQVEGIKLENAGQLERIRSSLTVLASHRTAYAEHQRQSLIRFYDRCAELLSDKLSTNLGDLPIDHGESLASYQNAVDALFTAIVLDYHRVLLFCEAGSELPALAERITKSSLNIRKAFKQHFGKAKLAIVEESQHYMAGDIDSYRRGVKQADAIVQTYLEAIRPAKLETQSLFSDFNMLLNLNQA